jgi:hypothetical protein
MLQRCLSVEKATVKELNIVSEKIPCKKCGVLILDATFKNNNGLCVPCHAGYRDLLDYRKEQRELEKKWEESPEGKFHFWVCDQKAKFGFKALSYEERLYTAVVTTTGYIINGGIKHFFTISYINVNEYYEYACLGFEAINKKECKEILEQSKTIIFGDGRIPVSEIDRTNILDGIENDLQKNATIEELDSKFYDLIDDYFEYLTLFVKVHDLCAKRGFI